MSFFPSEVVDLTSDNDDDYEIPRHTTGEPNHLIPPASCANSVLSQFNTLSPPVIPLTVSLTPTSVATTPLTAATPTPSSVNRTPYLVLQPPQAASQPTKPVISIPGVLNPTSVSSSGPRVISAVSSADSPRYILSPNIPPPSSTSVALGRFCIYLLFISSRYKHYSCIRSLQS